MTHARVPFLAVCHLRLQIHRIVRNHLFNLVARHLVSRDVRCVRFVPIKNDDVGHPSQYTYAVCIVV